MSAWLGEWRCSRRRARAGASVRKQEAKQYHPPQRKLRSDHFRSLCGAQEWSDLPSEVEVGVMSRGMSSIVVNLCLARHLREREQICWVQRWSQSLTESRRRI